MANPYTKHFNTRVTPQNEAIPGSAQVANSAGGYSFAIDDWKRLERFLILGSEGGNYYTNEQKLTKDNAQAVLRCIKENGVRVMDEVVDVSTRGRAPKNDPAIFVLAMCASLGDARTRRTALDHLSEVCRTGTHLFTFLDMVQNFRGWGRGLRRAVGDWYGSKSIEHRAFQLVKYQQRNGWTHRDALRLSKPKLGSQPDLQWLIGKDVPTAQLPRIIHGYKAAQLMETTKGIVKVIEEFPMLPWEAIPTQFLKSPEVWAALVPNMGLTAIIRNLGRMTTNGVIAPQSDTVKAIIKKITNGELLTKARVHPIQILGALCTYKLGHGVKGSLSWNPNAKILDALDEAFYLSFGNVEPTGKRICLALDVSGSMGSGDIAGMPGLTPRVGAAAMSLVTARSEKDYEIVAFTSPDGMRRTRMFGGQWGGGDPKLTHLDISPRQRMDDVVQAAQELPMGGTDCSLPMRWAQANKLSFDAFVVYTDNETWAGPIHPSQALRQYRETSGIPAKLIVVGMTANEFSIADPNDGGMMDVVGFDTAAPNIMSDFIRG